jgi:tetrahydromethanopterin:alpha-L-glutamate ligase
LRNVKTGVVGIPGKWSTETLADAIEERTGFRLVIDMSQVQLDLDRRILRYREHNLNDLDALVVKKISAEYAPSTLDRLEMLRFAESSGVRIFSSVESIIRLIDRLSCTVTLANNNIPMPPTVITEDIDQAIDAVHRFESAVFKPLFSTKARGMFILNTQQSAHNIRSTIESFKLNNPVMYIQQKLHLPGHDLGLVFLGGEYLGTYARVGSGDTWNTTIHSGGKYAAYDPHTSMIDIATRAQTPFNLDFTTVDMAETESGPVVFEVSAFGGFKGAMQGAGIDAAAAYADYVLQQV